MSDNPNILSVPFLPYAGTSGYSGTSTSEARARREDSNGVTHTTQKRILSLLHIRGGYGITIAELRALISEKHHGSLSGALSVLHKAHEISRLSEERDGCKIYVLPDCVLDRETEEHGREKTDLEKLIDYWMEPEETSVTGRTTQPRARKYPALFVTEVVKLMGKR